MENMSNNNYKKLILIMGVSFLIMYFVMFLNMDRVNTYHTSITRVYVAILMVAPMAILMMALMAKMYPNKKRNKAIIITSFTFFLLTFAVLRTQTPISDVQYMKAMIPHHSSAIMTSKHANIKDPEVRILADSIIASQEREIKQMEAILKRMK